LKDEEERLTAIENLIKRYKELEELNYTTIYLSGVYDKRNKWKIKIKEKIEELNKERVKMEKADYGIGFTLGEKWSDIKAKIQVLEELLE
jgi:hypothetical protein